MNNTIQQINVTDLKPGDRVMINYGCMHGSDDAKVVKIWQHNSGFKSQPVASVEIIGGANDGLECQLVGKSAFPISAIGWNRI